MDFDAVETRVLQVLNLREVRFVIVGGHAVNHYVPERHPHDLDVVLAPALVNAQRTIEALGGLKHRAQFAPGDLTMPGKQIRLALWTTDLLTSVHGVSYDVLEGDAVRVAVGEVTVLVSSRPHLLMMKGGSDRPRDIEDCRLLRATEASEQGDAPDEAELRTEPRR